MPTSISTKPPIVTPAHVATHRVPQTVHRVVVHRPHKPAVRRVLPHHIHRKAHRAKIVHPFTDVQADDVQCGNERQPAHGEQQVIDIGIGQVLGPGCGKEKAARCEVKHGGEVGKVAHPV